MEFKSIWDKYNDKALKELEKINKEYRSFLDTSKTEREAVDTVINKLDKAGFIEMDTITSDTKLKAGDCVYKVLMNKCICAFRIGKNPLVDGMNILGAHIDSPRLDVKQNPLFEKKNVAYLDTHYYGGIKKYQWVTIPLALHGVVVKKDGTIIELNIGENEDDPVFFISDLLIHLSAEQMEKKAAKVIEGEMLDVIIGNKPLKFEKEEDGKGKSAVKEGILDILKKNYDIEEDDFISAEIEVVPAGVSREAGFDRSMILGYGQDDRVCAYTSLKAMLDTKTCDRTTCLLLVDKEEIGSAGATGMQSRFFENTVAELLDLCGDFSELKLRKTLANCCMLSSDVSAAFDPNFGSVFEDRNSAYLTGGMVFNKYTGARGKSGSNDANPEFIAHIRNIFAQDEISYQTAELGRIDVGGGGTIAYILAKYAMNVIDAGVPVLNMHAPWECTSKADIYETYKGYMTFIKKAGM